MEYPLLTENKDNMTKDEFFDRLANEIVFGTREDECEFMNWFIDWFDGYVERKSREAWLASQGGKIFDQELEIEHFKAWFGKNKDI